MNLEKYNTIIFDCDGVILDSNIIKSNAFYTVAKQFGTKIADQFHLYHVNNGGLSRYIKFKFLIENLLNEEFSKTLHEKLLSEYENLILKQLIESELTDGIDLFLTKHKNVKKIVVSGGDEKELNYVFQKKALTNYFLKIKGSPKSKYENIEDLKSERLLIEPILFIGDSKLDYEVAIHYNFDFLFLYGYSEFSDWKEFFTGKDITLIQSFNEVLI